MADDAQMTPDLDEIYDADTALDAVQGTLEAFLETADVARVYGQPVQHGDTTILPAAEVVTGLGFAIGFGYGQGGDEEEAGSGGGAGGGGGGRTLTRPVAVIIADPQGVRVEPVVDITKVALAALTAGGFMLATLLRISNPRRALKQLGREAGSD